MNFTEWFLITDAKKILHRLDLNDLIMKSGLKDKDIETINKYSQGMMTAYDFVKNADKFRGGYSLGLSLDNPDSPKGTALTFSKMFGLQDWMKPWKQSMMSKDRNPDILYYDKPSQYVRQIATSGKPIVFFVPHEVKFSRHPGIKQKRMYKNKFDSMLPSGSYTSEEMNFFLENPELLKNTVFVFGIYSLLEDIFFMKNIAAKKVATPEWEQWKKTKEGPMPEKRTQKTYRPEDEQYGILSKIFSRPERFQSNLV